MQIHNAVITGSFSYNGADLSNVTSSNAYSASLSTRVSQIEQVYATTGSNSFRATQSITGSLTVTGQIIAQSLNVQQVTSSIVFSSGSNTFGCDLNSRQTFTGSVIMTGSLTVNTTGTELQVNNNGVILGNLLTDNHSVTGSLRITGSIASFSGNVGIGRTDDAYKLNVAVNTPKTCITARGLLSLTTCEPFSSNPFGLVVTATGGATLSDRRVTIGTTDFGSANGGMLELNSALYICNSGNVGMGKAPISYQNYRYLNIFGGSPTNGGIVRLETCDSSYVHEMAVDSSGGYLSSSCNFQIYVANSSRLYIKSNGNLGISTQDPILPLHVNSATGDYNTIFSTSCVCGRAGWVIARPGSTTAIASGLVLASDCSFRLGGGSYYNIKMLQDGSTTILNTSEGDALKVAAGGAVSINTGTSAIDASNQRLQVYGAIRQDVLGVSYGEGMIMNFPANGTNYGGLFFHSTATALATVGASSIKWGINYNYTPEDGVGAGNLAFANSNTTTMMNITSGGCVYIGKGWGATNHRINLQKPQGCTILVVSGYSGANNDSLVISAASGAGYNGALTVLGVTTNSSSGRSISAGGTINASGGDYAEYMTKRSDAGCIAKGQIVGIDACKLLTDKWSLAQSFVVKSTDPSYVGGDVWDKNIGKRPEQTTDVTDEEFAPILAEYESKLEEARNKVDRIAFSGQVPVVVSGSYNLGDYILPIEGPNDTILGVACSLSSLTLQDYGKTVGRVWGTCLDKAWIAVKIG